ncbi:MAG: AAA family ATPase [Candidatus Latescibacterota bacterium]|nr:MAG: AAA family ATPase [Candidatus Latescibacterota bacterium]
MGDWGLILAVILGVVVASILRLAFRGRATPEPATPPSEGPATGTQLYELARNVNYDVAHPGDLTEDPHFARGVSMLSGRAYTTEEVLQYAGGTNDAIAYMALEALVNRTLEPLPEEIVTWVGPSNPFQQYFLMRVLLAHWPATRPLIGDVLVDIAERRHPAWLDSAVAVDSLRNFVRKRLEAGEQPILGDNVARLDESEVEHLKKMLERLSEPGLSILSKALEEQKYSRIDREYLQSVGKLWRKEEPYADGRVISHAELEARVHELYAILAAEKPRSALLIGEAGVGKGAVAWKLLNRLLSEGWEVFEAGGSELIAGQKYIGELEERVRKLLQQLCGRKRIVWLIPDFHHLAWAGRHQYSQASVLDSLLPFIERGELLVLGKTQPGAYDRLVQIRPGCVTALESCRIQPLSASDTLALAEDWARTQSEDGPGVFAPETIREAWQLVQQYLGDKAAPGNLLQFLGLTLQRMRAAARMGEEPGPITKNDLVLSLSKLTGLPTSILDERERLDLHALQRHFETQVLDQPEAIGCLVERVAMIKAGVTDPSRPPGVFLFAGPTGTGKTEIAKSLADFLFGSPDRMIRLDMSEFQTPESLDRILGPAQASEASDGTFVDAIRRQPFSVVLLDEFEKAHPSVWDLFLQVFDDGRLTDRRGNLADFRQATIILTSNLGGLVPTGTSLGFSRAREGFRPEIVRRAIDKAFRREFVNRIDRIVIFQPLARETMREILVRELEAVFERRGLRNRGWAVEWEPAAVDFLLEKGFTSDLGARPLKRAIERYLLAPLAMTIVNHQAPQGDQFLFVTTDATQLEVKFVDPDALPGPESEEVAVEEPTPDVVLPGVEAQLRLEEIVLLPQGISGEIDVLQSHVESLSRHVSSARWQETKKASFDLMSSADFWESPSRFAVLGEAEYLDRIEAGVQRSSSLLQRLKGEHRRQRYPKELVHRLAQQLYLLRTACDDVSHNRPREAFLLLEAGRGPGIPPAQSDAFALRLGDMYRSWARERRMRFDVLEESGRSEGGSPYRFLLAVSGYGAHSLLAAEDGLHVYEEPDAPGSRGFRRYQAHVRVIPQPDEPAERVPGDDRRGALLAQARAALAQAKGRRQAVVRRYRESPSPLVRDGVRGWRTGRIQLVLAGHFDLMDGISSTEKARHA